MSTEPRIIKKYKNRRLYDASVSQYITVDDLQHYVVNGEIFQVVDAANGHDLTNSTLLQILVDMDATTTQLLSSDILRQLIIWANHPMHATFKTLLEQVLLTIKTPDTTNPYQAWSQNAETMLKTWGNLFKK